MRDLIAALLTAPLENLGFDCEEIAVTPAGKRRIVRVLVDKEGGLNLDDVAEASRLVSSILDEHEAKLGSTPYTLEVSSPGVDRPLTLERHWVRNISRLVKVIFREGAPITGRIMAVSNGIVTLDVGGAMQDIPIDDVAKARIEVEFNREEK
jgi:ribosome maturation factor RimP